MRSYDGLTNITCIKLDGAMLSSVFLFFYMVLSVVQVTLAADEFEKTNTQRTIISEGVDVDDVSRDADERTNKYNSSNHWVDGKKPDDYDAVREKLKTGNWIEELKEGKYETVIIPKEHVKWMLNTHRSVTRHVDWKKGELPAAKADDLDDILDGRKYKEKYQGIEKKIKEHFLRTDYASFKGTRWREDSEYNTSTRKLLESLVLSDPTHSPLAYKTQCGNPDPDELKIYLIPWQEIGKDREFRVFVKDNHITAISQQYLFDVNETLCALNESERSKKIKKWCDIIEEYFHEKIQPKIKYIESYVLDIAVVDRAGEEVAYPIELNPFGKEYTSASALFDWIRHEKSLYGRSLKELLFRYVYRESARPAK